MNREELDATLLALLKGALVAAAGAALAHVAAWAASTDLGSLGPTVGAVLAVLANAVRKLGPAVVSATLPGTTSPPRPTIFSPDDAKGDAKDDTKTEGKV